MRKFVTSVAAVGSAVVALTMGASVPASAAVPADYSCNAFTMSDARVGIACNYVRSGEVRGYAVCAGVDSNIATPWVGVTSSNYVAYSDYKCRWGIRDYYVEARG